MATYPPLRPNQESLWSVLGCDRRPMRCLGHHRQTNEGPGPDTSPRILGIGHTLVGRERLNVQERDQTRANFIRLKRRHGRSIVRARYRLSPTRKSLLLGASSVLFVHRHWILLVAAVIDDVAELEHRRP